MVAETGRGPARNGLSWPAGCGDFVEIGGHTIVPLMLAFLILAAPLAFGSEAARIGCEDARAKQLIGEKGLVFLDVRSPAEFADGHIGKALNVPEGRLGSAQLPAEGRIVVYCSEDPCALTDNAHRSLVELGYTNAVILAGGLGRWKELGYPLVKGVPRAAAPRPGRLSPQQVRARLDKGDLTVVDVRPATEYATGHLPGALGAPVEKLVASTFSAPRDRDVLVYDASPERSRAAAERLLAAGYKVFEMPGGLMGWIKRKYPLDVR